MIRRAWRFTILVLLVAGLLPQLLTPAYAQEGRHVNVASLNGAVDPMMAQYIMRVIDTSVDDGAVAVIIVMDTPGGLDSSMRQHHQQDAGLADSNYRLHLPVGRAWRLCRRVHHHGRQCRCHGPVDQHRLGPSR